MKFEDKFWATLIIGWIIIPLLVLVVVMYSCPIHGAEIDCDKNPIYCNILDKKPDMVPSKAMELSNTIYKYSKKYKQNPHISVAIGMQETGLKQANREQNIIVFDDSDKGWSVVKGYSDVCMFQFHVNTIVAHNLNPIKLKNDLDYCVEQHFKLMQQKRKICSHLGKDSWTCYHSVNKIPREFYKKLVERYF